MVSAIKSMGEEPLGKPEKKQAKQEEKAAKKVEEPKKEPVAPAAPAPPAEPEYMRKFRLEQTEGTPEWKARQQELQEAAKKE